MLAEIMSGCAGTGATTNIGSSDPSLHPHVYSLPYDTVWDAAVKAATSVKGWAVTSTDWNGGVIALSMGFNMWTTGTKMTVHVQRIGAVRTQVDMQSALSGFNGILMSDYGQNRRNVVRFFEELDRTLAADGRGASAIRKENSQGFQDALPTSDIATDEGETVEFSRLQDGRAVIRVKGSVPFTDSQHAIYSFVITSAAKIRHGGKEIQLQDFNPPVGSHAKIKYQFSKNDQTNYALEIDSK